MPRCRVAVCSALLVSVLAACASDSRSAEPETQSSVSSESSVSGAVFVPADITFAQGMIPHHLQAIEMADLALTDGAGASPEIRAIAQAVRVAQDPEVQQLTALLKSWDQPVESEHGDHLMTGMLSQEQMTELAASSGPAFDQMWATLMIEHHEGAIEMAKTVLGDGSDPTIHDLATAVVSTQQAEIEQLQALLDA
ncbi:MAG: DUF305 domain-containing protein [Ilumatobacteraceae bacterium]